MCTKSDINKTVGLSGDCDNKDDDDDAVGRIKRVGGGTYGCES